MITEIQHILPLAALRQSVQSTTESKTNYFDVHCTMLQSVEIRKRMQGHDFEDSVIVYVIMEVTICILRLQWQLVNFIFLCTCHASQGI